MQDARDITAEGRPPHRRTLRVGVLSDLHLEYDRAQPALREMLRGRRRLDRTPVDSDGHPVYGPRLDVLRDVDLVLACGDIDVKTWPVPWLDAASRYTGRPWFYVMGNHENYDRPVENALRDLRARQDTDAVLVATHHAPSGRSIPERRRGHPLSTAYASDLEHMMWRDGPDLWAHGHIHRPVDYRVGETRVVAAPRGRIGHEPGAEARRPLLVEIMIAP